MKKYLLFFLLAGLGACKKTDNSNATVEYELNFPKSGSFTITYADANAKIDTIAYTGTSWSKTISVNPNTAFKTAIFGVYADEIPSDMTGDVRILVNGQNKDDDPQNFYAGESGGDNGGTLEYTVYK